MKTRRNYSSAASTKAVFMPMPSARKGEMFYQRDLADRCAISSTV